MLRGFPSSSNPTGIIGFNGHPPLGVNATRPVIPTSGAVCTACFNGHPPLGVNATPATPPAKWRRMYASFNGHPPLGVNATRIRLCLRACILSFNGHPPLGVNATRRLSDAYSKPPSMFQRAPTLGGECYARYAPYDTVRTVCFNGHPPLGVNATRRQLVEGRGIALVSTGTHPWG
mgnify:CR=1 FL=1